MCHPLCAMIVLLVDILEEPGTAQSTMLLQTIRSFTAFLETFQREEKCDLSRMVAACDSMVWVAQGAVQRAREVVVPEAAAGANSEVRASCREEYTEANPPGRSFSPSCERPRRP